MLFAHAFVASGSVVSADSYNRFRDLIDERRVSAGVGLTFVFRNVVRLEINYVLPLRYRPADSCTPGFQFGAGINFM